jgi:hypothetical protein
LIEKEQKINDFAGTVGVRQWVVHIFFKVKKKDTARSSTFLYATRSDAL